MSHEIAVKMLASTVVIQSLDRGWGIHFQEGFTHMAVVGGLSSSTLGSLHRKLECHYCMAPSSLRASDLREREQAGSHSSFCDLVSEVVHCHGHFVLLVRSESLSLASLRGKEN